MDINELINPISNGTVNSDIPSMWNVGMTMLIAYKSNPSIRNVPKPKVNTMNRNEMYDIVGHSKAFKTDRNNIIRNVVLKSSIAINDR